MPVKCPQDCQNNHSEHRINMTKIFGKLDNIEDTQAEQKQQLQVLIKKIDDFAEKKADKDEVKALREKIETNNEASWTTKEKVLVWAVGILLAIIAFGIKYFVLVK